MRSPSPFRSALILLVSIFATESLLMILLAILPPRPEWLDVLLNSIALAVLLLPALFFLVFRPLHAEIAERRRAEAALCRRDAILRAVAFAADRFLQAAWEPSVGEVLARLGQAAEVSRVYIFENQAAEGGVLLTSQRYEWTAPQIDNPQLQNFPLRAGGFVRWEERLGQGQPVHGHVRQFPESEREVLAAQDILSILIVPIFVERLWWGFIGFDDCLLEREWSAPEIEVLRAAADILGAAIQRKQRERELAALYAVAHAAAQSLDPDKMLNDSLDEVLKALAVEFGGIMLLEPDGQTLKLRAHRGVSPEFAESVGAAQTSEVSETSEVCTDRLKAAFLKEGIQMVAGVPLVAKGQIVGALGLGSRRPRALPPETLDFLTSIGRELGIAVKNAWLYAQTRDARDAVLNMLDDLTEARDREQARAKELELLAERLSTVVEDSDRLATQLAAVNRLDRVISASLDLNEVYRALAQESQKIISFDRMSVALVEGDQVRALGVEVGVKTPIGEEAIFPLAGSGIEAVIESEQPLIRRDLLAEERYAQDRAMIEAGLRSTMLAPLAVKGRALGAFGVASRQVGTYSEKDVTILQSLADQLAIAVENARLYQTIRWRVAELSALFMVSSALRGAEAVEEMLPIILDRTLEVIRADTGALFLLETPSDHFTVRVARGRMRAMSGFSFPREGSATARCLEIGQPLQDIQLPPAPEMAAALTGEERAIQIPLQVGQAAVGVMHLCFPGHHEFTDDEIRLLTAIADMAANAIHRASLFEQLERRVHELSALFDVGKMVTATLRIEDVLDFIVGAATEAVHAEGCYLFLWEEREERLVMRATRGLAPGLVGQVKYRLGEGLSGWVFLEGRVANVPDVAADPRWKPESDWEGAHPSGLVVSALVAPLVVGGKTLGVLGVVNKIADGRRPTAEGAQAAVSGRPSVVVFSQSDESLLTALAGQAAIAIENARLYEEVRGLSVAAIRSLAAAIDARDPYTRGHSEGVTHLAARLARELGWSSTDLEMLEFAALLHDVGKIAVPDAILRKVEPLTPDEWNIIRLHPYHSAQIVKPVESLQRIVPWVYHHHERWDGSGYPDGLKGEFIPLAARIIAVADTFNAMTTDRPYRRGCTETEALAEIRRNAGKQFDPVVVQAFLREIGKG